MGWASFRRRRNAWLSAPSAPSLRSLWAPRRTRMPLDFWPALPWAAPANGIDPVVKPVTLQIGSLTAAIPPASFTRSPLGTYTFIGTINGVNMEVVIQPTGGKQFAVEAAALNANLAGTANPVTVRLSIGDDCGTAPVNALIF
jgi:hypothetical protein